MEGSRSVCRNISHICGTRPASEAQLGGVKSERALVVAAILVTGTEERYRDIKRDSRVV